MPEPIEETCPRCHGWVWHRAEPCTCKVGLLPGVADAAEFRRALGSRLRALRAAAGLSLDELAARTGLSKAGLWEVERGRNEPMARTVVVLADALNVSADYLLLRRD